MLRKEDMSYLCIVCRRHRLAGVTKTRQEHDEWYEDVGKHGEG